MKEQQQKCSAKQLAGANRCSSSGSDGVMDKAKKLATLPATLNSQVTLSSKASSTARSRSCHDNASLSSQSPLASSETAQKSRSCRDNASLSSQSPLASSETAQKSRSCRDNASLTSQSPLGSSETAQKKPASWRNPLLTWTTEELQLVSQMRQSMKNTGRRKRSKKPKDAPKRPLSAYNIFFKEERQRIIDQEGMLSGFENLAKTIGARWKRMTSDEERAPYKEKAELDSKRYENEMAAYVEKRSDKAAPNESSRNKTKR